MGMQVRLVLYADDEELAATAARAAFAEIARLDSVLSDYRPDSEVSSLTHRAGAWQAVGDELFEVLDAAVELSMLSGGAFDVGAGAATARWKAAIGAGRLPDEAALESWRPPADAGARPRQRGASGAALRVDRANRAVWLAPGTRLDLGAIAKGYILDRARDVVRAMGAESVLLEAGGDIVVGAAPPGSEGWTIRVPHAGCTVVLHDAAVSTSGDSEQFVEIDGRRYSHVIDPRTGRALIDGRVATVIAPDGMQADALATTLTVLEPTAGRTLLAAYPGAVDFRCD